MRQRKRERVTERERERDREREKKDNVVANVSERDDCSLCEDERWFCV